MTEGYETAGQDTSGVDTLDELLARIAQVGQHRGGVIVACDGGQEERRWPEVVTLACRAADGLARRGIGLGDRVALAAGNSLEWIVTDFAVHMLGAVLVPLHVSLSGQQLAWQLAHSGSRLLIVGGPEICSKIPWLPDDVELLALTAALDPRSSHPAPLWAEMAALGDEAEGRERWKETRAAVSRSTLASIVYTSGTSGEPRGVMLTQGNLAANALATVSSFGSQPDDCRLNLLPFSHAFGRMSDLYVSLAASTRLALCRSRETLFTDAQQVRPTLIVVVPLILSRLRQAVTAQFGAADTGAVNNLLGGRVRGFICGGATLSEDLREYFAAQETPVYEGYGLTEAAPVVSASSERARQANSVGKLLPGTMAQIGNDGELFIKGPQVMAGYWRDEAATRETLRDGWLQTGDLGAIDRDGFLSIYGRKKEFIALASGKKVWPAAIEALFASDSLIEQIMLVGEGESMVGALVVPRERENPDGLNSENNQQRFLAHVSARLESRAAHEQVRRVWLLSEPWTAERDELTPKQTIRRQVILARYADCIRRLFQEDENHDDIRTN